MMNPMQKESLLVEARRKLKELKLDEELEKIKKGPLAEIDKCIDGLKNSIKEKNSDGFLKEIDEIPKRLNKVMEGFKEICVAKEIVDEGDEWLKLFEPFGKGTEAFKETFDSIMVKKYAQEISEATPEKLFSWFGYLNDEEKNGFKKIQNILKGLTPEGEKLEGTRIVEPEKNWESNQENLEKRISELKDMIHERRKGEYRTFKNEYEELLGGEIEDNIKKAKNSCQKVKESFIKQDIEAMKESLRETYKSLEKLRGGMKGFKRDLTQYAWIGALSVITGGTFGIYALIEMVKEEFKKPKLDSLMGDIKMEEDKKDEQIKYQEFKQKVEDLRFETEKVLKP